MSKTKKTNETIQTNTDNKSKLVNVFKSCLNILRDGEGLTGDKALRNMSHLLILKLIESHFGNKIDIDNYNYNFDHMQDDVIEYHKTKLLEYVRFSKLVNEGEGNLSNVLKYLWEDILSVHPSTKNIFLKGKNFDIQDVKTFKKLINKINELDLSKTEYDVLGNAYEEVIQDIMTGKVLGQFFTQPLIKKIMVKLIDPKIYPDGKIETCCDPTMGTGGFLITYLQYILNKSKESNIELDWDFIKTEGLYGKELEPDTYQLAVSNMLISSGYMFEQLDRGDSIREPILKKYDNVLANPPFGIKGLKYDDFNNIYKSEYLPIKTDNAVSLFIQLIIYMLKINGKCAVVLPDGQDLFSKTNSTLIAVRKYLLKTCDLKEIMYLPSGMFTNTGIKTCIFYFIKKVEGMDILETIVNISKTQKETSRNYKFSKINQTNKIIFYEYDTDKDIKNLLVEVSIEQIINNSYSLNYSEYIQVEEEQYEDDIIIKTLGEICTFLPKSKRQASYGNDLGLYPFFKSSMKINTFVDEPDYIEESLIIGDGGEPNINYGINFSTSDHCYILQNINKLNISLKFIYYYIFHNLDNMSKLYTGVAIKNISKINISNIKIPIPSIEKQKIAIEYLDLIYEKSNKEDQEKIKTLIKLNNYCLNNQKIFGENIIKMLGEVCTIIKGEKKRSKDGKELGLYPLYYCSILGNLYLDTYDYEDEGIIINKTNGSGKAMVYYGNNKYNVGETTIHFKSKTLELQTKYIYYYLLYNIELLQKYYKGCNQKSIIENDLFKIKILIPSIERQQEIIKYCESNDILIKQLEDNIIQNKKQAQLFISNIVKSINQNDLLDIESINSSEEEQ